MNHFQANSLGTF